jgi:hypothetical protein
MDKEAHYKKLEIEWWKKMLEKYNISDFTKIDVMTGQFYVCLDENNNAKIEYRSNEVKEEDKGDSGIVLLN